MAAKNVTMAGMLTDDQIKALNAAQGVDFDRKFLEYMIQHHSGAIKMVNDLFATPGGGQEVVRGQLAKALIEQATEQQQIDRSVLTLHADRGGPMRGKPVAFLLADMGITKTHSRPYTSTDNPYSEAHFKTLKYRPEFPERFDDIEQARDFCRGFFHWSNHQHHHSGIGLMTPAAVHHGQAQQLHAARARVLEAAHAATPERFVRRAPVPPELPTAAWINKPDTKQAAH